MVYPRRYVKTRRQAAWQTIALVFYVAALLAWRLPQQRPIVGLALALLALAPFVTAFRGLRFLRRMEAQYATPTLEMTFIFEQLVVVPPATGAFLLILLLEM